MKVTINKQFFKSEAAKSFDDSSPSMIDMDETSPRVIAKTILEIEKTRSYNSLSDTAKSILYTSKVNSDTLLTVV